jgi:hypothetical protein
MDVDRICLLEINPPGLGMAQRRVMQVRIDGEEVWREFETVRVFDSAGEAQAYAQAHGVEDAVFTREQADER